MVRMLSRLAFALSGRLIAASAWCLDLSLWLDGVAPWATIRDLRHGDGR